jgi:glycine/D-amino acid oxidase-like deaminating enzyme
MNVDYLLVGQGISGTLLSRSLIKEGASVLVIDDGNASASSRVAGGVINPVTGKRLVKTWLIDELLPFALDTYTAIGQEMNTDIVSKCSILNMFPDLAARGLFEDRQGETSEYLHTVDSEQLSPYFRFNYGAGAIDPCLLVAINKLLSSWRAYLMAGGMIREEQFTFADCLVENTGVNYKGINAKAVIFCDGAVCSDNPFFERLPWSKDKGEALIVSIPGLPADHIYNQGFSIVPWKDDLFWVGATHDWKYTDMQSTAAFRASVEGLLNYWLKLPYKVMDHVVGRRPVNADRKPFVGMHPVHKSVGIFNGMGTKGCSVAPYFAAQFAAHLVHGSQLMPEVNVSRFARILSRS